ncbi:hypothetical protein ACHAXR_005934 [Thalassiosira sp. AJA248-18]
MTTFSKISPVADVAEELRSTDDFDLTLLIAIVTAAQTEQAHLEKVNADLLFAAKREARNRRHYQKKKRARHRQVQADTERVLYEQSEETPSPKSKFPTWSTLSDEISDIVFRRKYRMSKTQFDLLCHRIQEKVGEDVFRSENNQGLCGQIRIAIGLRILCGGSYVDLLGRAYGVQAISSIYKYFHTFIGWVDETFDFPLVGLLRGLNAGDQDAIEKLHEISADFAVDSDHCFIGCIGAIDGLAIRIKCPSNVSDPGNYFCRKNFYALNVQAICDRNKRILWISPGHLGASHDSTAWSETQLKDLFEKVKGKLKEHGFYTVGDSAYPLSVYLQVPYPNAKPASAQDAYNFWLSNSRIFIECTFGEFIMRFGLFWRTLRFDLADCCDIIRSAAKLHNFLVDSREGTAGDDNYFRNMSYASISSEVSIRPDDDDDDEVPFPMVSDNNEPRPSGRKSKKRKSRESEGDELRNSICTSLFEDGLGRPRRNRTRYNALGHVYHV